MIKTKGVILTIVAIFCAVVAMGESHYGLFEKPNTSSSMAKMKPRTQDNVIVWQCDSCELDHTICLRVSDYDLSPRDQEILELSELVRVPVKTPWTIKQMTGRVSFNQLGFTTNYQLKGATISLTFKRSGMPDTLYVGTPAPDRRIKLPAPEITQKSPKTSNNCRGTNYSFEASEIRGFPQNKLIYNWYIDGVWMSGRSDRWFETYSRTCWADGQHLIECEAVLYHNGHTIKSPRGKIYVNQLPSEDCFSKTKVSGLPYWGADCWEEDEQGGGSTDFRWSEKTQRGSFEVTPMDEYVHYRMNIIGKEINHCKVTNLEDRAKFEIIERPDTNYRFFDVPTNIKFRFEDPKETRTVYFEIVGDTIHYSAVPFITPSVSIDKNVIEICENSFDPYQEKLKATATGYESNTAEYQWMYCKTIDGEYQPEVGEVNSVLTPTKVGFYKVVTTDGVHDCESTPSEVSAKSGVCQSVEIIQEGNGYVCLEETAVLKSSLTGDKYTYRWLVGNDTETDMSKLEEIKGETKETFVASHSEPGKAYYLAVTKNGKEVFSKPVKVRLLLQLNGTEQVELSATPHEVCEGSQVNLKVTATRNGKPLLGAYDFRVLRKGDYEFDYSEVRRETSLGGKVAFGDILETPSKYSVELIGCNGKEVLAQPAYVKIKSDAMCQSGNLYVKMNGDDENNDGRSWETAFKTLQRAIVAAEHMRQSEKYRDTHISIHLGDNTYTAPTKAGFSFPSNTTVYGGYDISPVDGTVSGTYRSIRTPSNQEGNFAILRQTDPDGYVINIEDKKNVKLWGLHIMGPGLVAESNVNGAGVMMEGSELEIDSCVIEKFRFNIGEMKPLTAVYVVECKDENNWSKLTIKNTTFTEISGARIGACLSVMDDAEVEIRNCTFTNNTSLYEGAVALLTYNSSPKINILNSTFYDNTSTNAFGYYGRQLMRFLGGEPVVKIYSSTLCGRFYKERGRLEIYNSLVQCAGRADVYENNYPAKNTFKDNEKRDENRPDQDKAFLANFKGNAATKLSPNKGGITSVLVPGNKLEVIGQAGKPHPLTPTDQRGVMRSPIQSTFGACDADYSVVIEITDKGCPDHKNTKATFKSVVAGLTNVKYQWVNNYTDISGETKSGMKNAGIGTYWLDVKGEDMSGNKVSASSNEIRVSDVCEEPGIYYVKTADKGGNDEYAGTTWDQAFASLEKALKMAVAYKKSSGVEKAVTIHIAGGEYKLKSDAGLAFENLKKLEIVGGYTSNPSKGAKRAQKRTPKDPGFATKIVAHSAKGKFAEFTSDNKNLKITGLWFVGSEGRQVPLIGISGADVAIDSCMFGEFASDANGVGIISVSKTSDIKVRGCYVYTNKGADAAFMNIGEKGNKSQIQISGCTFADNHSTKNGGSVINVANGSPTINIANTTMFKNTATDPALCAVGAIRLMGGNANVNVVHSTLCGTYLFEGGDVVIANSIVEAEGGAKTDNCYVHVQKKMTNVGQVPTAAEQESFKAIFGPTNLGNSHTPYLKFAKEMEKVKAYSGGVKIDMSKDQRGEKREGDRVVPGAVEVGVE